MSWIKRFLEDKQEEIKIQPEDVGDVYFVVKPTEDTVELLKKILNYSSYIISYSDSDLVTAQCNMIHNEIEKYFEKYNIEGDEDANSTSI